MPVDTNSEAWSAGERVRALAADRGVEVVAVDNVLLSVLPTAEVPHTAAESAFWSAGSGVAVILAGLGEQPA